MIVTTTPAPGTFCWPELSTSNQVAAEKFYTSLFGWTVSETPMGPDSHYTIFQKDGVPDEDHSLVWTELCTDDTTKAAAFYNGLFGWTTEKWADSPMDYTILKRGDAMAGGMMAKTPEMGPVPNHWMPYYGVADCDGTVKKAEGLGANVVVPPMDVPNVGRTAVLADPQGATFSIMQFAPRP